MDFLEGFLLGPIWSDTEYETRRHTGFYWLLGWLTLFLFIYFVFYPDAMPGFLGMPRYLPILLFAILAIVSPLACRYYYQLNIFLKIGILIFQIFKFGFAFIAFFQFWLLQQAELNMDIHTLPQVVLDYINTTIAKTTDYFTNLGQGVGMLVGIVSGGLKIVLIFAGYLLAATLAPVLFLIILKTIQRGIDLLARATIFRYDE
jgi:hypothetical protein